MTRASQFETEAKPGYLLVRCRELSMPASLVDVCEEAAVIASSKGHKALLVDIRGVQLATGMPSTMDRYGIGARLAELTLKHRLRIALVGDEPLIDPRRFGEIVFHNRAGNGRVFTDIDQARVWLDEQPG